jgi:hypothetical protein
MRRIRLEPWVYLFIGLGLIYLALTSDSEAEVLYSFWFFAVCFIFAAIASAIWG